MHPDERTIRDLVERWVGASAAGDLQTVLSLMADDVIFMVPGRGPFGKQEFAAAFEGMTGIVQGMCEIKELQVLGDWAYLRNYIKVTAMPHTDKPVRRSGYTLTILRKQSDGRWLITRDANLLSTEA
jgi:uncharacterized protein (TIGR02246 family)